MNSNGSGRTFITTNDDASLHKQNSIDQNNNPNNSNNYFSISFNSDDLCSLLDKFNPAQRKARASESSTLFDTCSSNSSTTSSTYNNSTTTATPTQATSINYKPIVSLSPNAALNISDLNYFENSDKAFSNEFSHNEQPAVEADPSILTSTTTTNINTTAVSVIDKIERCDYLEKNLVKSAQCTTPAASTRGMYYILFSIIPKNSIVKPSLKLETKQTKNRKIALIILRYFKLFCLFQPITCVWKIVIY